MSGGDDDARLYTCMKKYEEMVQQVMLLDELTESMDPRSRLPKKKRNSRNNSSCSATNGASVMAAEQERLDQVIVQTITKFLHDLNTSSNNGNINPKSKPYDQ